MPGWASPRISLLLFPGYGTDYEEVMTAVEVHTGPAWVGDEQIRVTLTSGPIASEESLYSTADVVTQLNALIRDTGVDFGLLICPEDHVSRYEPFGWQHVQGPLVFKDMEKEIWSGATMVLRCSGRSWLAGTVHVEMGIEARRMRRRSWKS